MSQRPAATGPQSVRQGGQLAHRVRVLRVLCSTQDGTIKNIKSLRDIVATVDYKVPKVKGITANGKYELGTKKYTAGATWDGTVANKNTTLKVRVTHTNTHTHTYTHNASTEHLPCRASAQRTQQRQGWLWSRPCGPYPHLCERWLTVCGVCVLLPYNSQLFYTNKDKLVAGEGTVNLKKNQKVNTTFNQKQLLTAKYTYTKVRRTRTHTHTHTHHPAAQGMQADGACVLQARVS